jgi:hypothetical protein
MTFEDLEGWQQTRQLSEVGGGNRRTPQNGDGNRATRGRSHPLHGIPQIKAGQPPLSPLRSALYRMNCRMNPLSSLLSASATCLCARRNWMSALAAFSFFKAGTCALAQDASAKTPDDSAAKTSVEKAPLELRLGPLDLHPRVTTGLTYDDNILFSSANPEADTFWTIQPALQAVAGDDAALIAYRDQNYDVLNLAPGNLIIQPPEAWPGKLLILDYGPRFQFFNQYTANNAIDQFGTLNLLWPLNRLILGFKQDYQLQKTTIIEAGIRTTVETISSTLAAAYQIGEKTSLESNFRRISVGYDQLGLIGYTEYNTEDWFNYVVTEGLPVSVGVLAGLDEVANQQGQTYEQLRARARYNYTEKLAFDASVGGELRQYDNGSPDTLSPVFTIAGEYRPAERTALRLTGYRQQNASIFNGYNYTSTGATLSLRQGITDRYTADLSVGYYTLDYAPTSGALVKYTDEYYTARIGLEAKIIRHLTGKIFYQLISRLSGVGGGINDNQAGVQLILSY